MLLPEIVALAPLASDRVNEEIARAIAARMQARLTEPDRSPVTSRLRGLANALRFARIPLVVALVVALANTERQPRLLALVLGALVIVAGLVAHWREIVFGDAAAGDRASLSHGTRPASAGRG